MGTDNKNPLKTLLKSMFWLIIRFCQIYYKVTQWDCYIPYRKTLGNLVKPMDPQQDPSNISRESYNKTVKPYDNLESLTRNPTKIAKSTLYVFGSDREYNCGCSYKAAQ